MKFLLIITLIPSLFFCEFLQTKVNLLSLLIIIAAAILFIFFLRKNSLPNNKEKKTLEGQFKHPNDLVVDKRYKLKINSEKRSLKFIKIINKFERIKPWLNKDQWTDEKKILIPSFIEEAKSIKLEIDEYNGTDKDELTHIRLFIDDFITSMNGIERP